MDDGKHVVLSVVVKAANPRAGPGLTRETGNTSWLREAHQYDFEVTGGFWGVFYEATQDPEPICIMGLGSGIGALLGVAVQRLLEGLPTCAMLIMTEKGNGKAAPLSTALREVRLVLRQPGSVVCVCGGGSLIQRRDLHQFLNGQRLDQVEEDTIRPGSECWAYRHQNHRDGVLYLSQGGSATKTETYFSQYINGTCNLYGPSCFRNP